MPNRAMGGLLVITKTFFCRTQNLALQTAQHLFSTAQNMPCRFLHLADEGLNGTV